LAHTAGRAGSACDTALNFWNAVQRQVEGYNHGRERSFDQLTASLREMNSSSDDFNNQARLAFNLRLPPDLTVSQAAELVAGHHGEADLRLMDGVECYRADKNTAAVRALLASIRSEGGKPSFLLKTGTSDMNIVGPVWKIPILAYGPGDSSLDHTPHEHISITEYLTSVRVLSQALNCLQS
jgi:LysW-gamma-L-lysine carboxypeptidase